jgi:hypothetical protein
MNTRELDRGIAVFLAVFDCGAIALHPKSSIGRHSLHRCANLLSRSRERTKVRENLRLRPVFANSDATTPGTIERFPQPALRATFSRRREKE